MEYVALCVLCLLVGGIIGRKWARRAEGRKSEETGPVEAARGDAAEEKEQCGQRQRSYEENERQLCARHGELPCDGLRCTPYARCSPAERLFCRDVLSGVVGEQFFSAQYAVRLPSGNYRIDFVVGLTDGRRLAVELDDFQSHVADSDPARFSRELRRQNELLLAGWTVLRFSFRQLIKETAWCREVLRTVMTGVTCPPPLCGPLPRAEVGSVADTDAAKRCGLQFSERSVLSPGGKGCWYINNLNEVETSVPNDWAMKVWADCLTPGCTGHLESRQRRADGCYFWYCRTCGLNLGDRSGGSRRSGPKPRT